MREILFRGKSIDDGKWKYSMSLARHATEDGIITSYYIGSGYDIVKAETVGEYTGLTDKNGKKIFEGDIVKADDYIFVVRFGKCGGVANNENYGYIGFYLEAFSESTKLSAKYGLRDDICYFTDIEIIGNIHENPELFRTPRNDEVRE